ncbi:DUF5018 domain-containing protein [Winogradskyella sp. MIT101101]|uniref:DUF5018 domain-containing protein n=1 Tax=Winogradskyella sp. MIT101101 TaxID=3098297 RepID=UPI003999B308
MKQYKKLLFFVMLISASILSFTIVSCNSDDDNFTDVVPDIAEAIIRSFETSDQFATINHTSATITATLPSGTNLNSLTVNMTLPEGTTVDPASGSTLDFSSGPIIFTTNAANGASRQYTATLAAFGDPKILSFSVGDNAGVIDDAAGTITVDIGSQDGDITSLAPNFVIADGTTVDVASGVSRNFSNPVVYTVQSNDGFTAKEYTVTVNQVPAPQITSFVIDGTTGVVNDTDETIYVLMPPGTDVTNLSPVVEVPTGQTVNPASGTAQDFTNTVDYTVTNTENLNKTYTVTVEVQTVIPTFYAFLGEQADIASLIDDDAKAAALWMQSTYGADFKYIQFSNITGAEMADVKVAMAYYLTPLENVGYSATSTDVSTLLPAELQTGAPQAEALKTWVKLGGDMLIAGEATPLIFSLGRVPADFSAPRAPGNYVYSEFGCAGTGGCVDMNKPPDDRWGLGMRPENNSEDRRNHPIFNGLTFFNDEFLALQNSATREVRLIWWQHFDNILSPSCCGQDAALLFEQNFSATKFGTLSFIGDAFGYGAVMWNRTDQANDPNFDSQIPTDFQGTIMSIENTIVGYEWDSNGTVNDFQSNIETFTGNILDYLYNLN